MRVGGGVEGDSHVHRAKRAVTVVDRSTHDAVGVKPGDLREQITVEGLPALGSLAEGMLLRVGAVTLRVNGPCDPCEHIGEMNGADPPEFQALNVLSTAGASILGVGYLLPLVYLIWSLRYGKVAGPNPWGATGLEWRTPSPPPTENFEKAPVVTEEPYAYATWEAEVG